VLVLGRAKMPRIRDTGLSGYSPIDAPTEKSLLEVD
jgi:hypothetical protein